VIPKCNVLDVESATEAVDIISSWLTTIHSWPNRFHASKIFRRYGPFAEEGAKIALDNSTAKYKDIPDRVIAKAKEKDAANELPRLDYAMDENTGMRFVKPWDVDRYVIYLPQFDVVKVTTVHSDSKQKDIQSPPVKGKPEGIRKRKNSMSLNSKEDKFAPDARWYSRLHGEQVRIPKGFNFRLLLELLWALSTSDRFQIVLKALEFMYNHWKQFPPTFADQLRNMFIAPIILHGTSPLVYLGTVYQTTLTYGQDDLAMHRCRSDWSYRSTGDLSELTEDDESVSDSIIKRFNSDISRSRSCDFHIDTCHEFIPLFVQLFYHWSKHVRNFFHTLLTYRLTRANVVSKSKHNFVPLGVSDAHHVNECVARVRAAVQVALHSTPLHKHLWTRLWGSLLPKINDTTLQFEMVDAFLTQELQEKLEDPTEINETNESNAKRKRSRSRSLNLIEVEKSHRQAVVNTKKEEGNIATRIETNGKQFLGEDHYFSLRHLENALGQLGHEKWPGGYCNPAIAITSVWHEFKPMWDDFNKLINDSVDGKEISIPDLEVNVVVEETGAMRVYGGAGKIDGSAADDGVKPIY